MSKRTKAADPDDPQELEKLQEDEARRQHEEDLKWLLADPRGRRLYWNLMSDCGVFRSSFTGNSATFFNEGRRDVGLKLLADLTDICPQMYVVMVQEQQEDSDD